MGAMNLEGVPTDLYIGGTWRGSEDGSRFDVTDPATGAVLTSVANGTVADGIAAVAAAHAAAPAWAATPPRQRGEILRKAFELMTERSEQIARLMVAENGKALPDARGEVTYAAEFFRWYSEEAVRLNGSIATAPSGANRILVIHQPVGVSVLVTPWNFPAAMATRKIGPALAAGCTVILKPASETPLTALYLAKLLAEAGVPDGVVNVVPSTRSGAVVNAMIHDPRVRKLSFTGSTAVGRALLAQAADQVVSCSMELGGNAPFIILPDADIPAAIDGLMVAKMRNGGQACTAANRIYVHADVHDRVVAELAELLSPGDLVVDGGNSHYADDREHAARLGEKGIGFVDVGVSGGVWGLRYGYALMVGGAEEDVRRLMPIFETLKPEGEDGFVHAGGHGAGHFAKMVHNGIEYGMMQSFAEGWELLEASDLVTDVAGCFRSWRSGTVIRSWLLDLLVRALEDDADLSELRGYAEDSGEGRWAVQAAVEHAVPLPVITAALYARFASRQPDSPAMKVVAALRNQFGGHAVASAEGAHAKGADSPGADVVPPVDTEK